MELKKLTGEISVAAQIAAVDVAGIAAQGFKSILGNRPDGEGADQPLFAEIEREARTCGLESRYLPVATGEIRDEDVLVFRSALAELPKPILAYCRSGTRSATLWALAEAGRRPLCEIIEVATQAGYDMSGVVNRISNCGVDALAPPSADDDIVIGPKVMA